MIRAMNGRQTVRGFTLIELLVTIAVLTVLVSVGVPMYGEFTKNAGVTSRTSDLVAAINLARSESVSRHATVRLSPLSGAWRNGWQVSLVSAGTVLQVIDFGDRQQDVAVTEASTLVLLDFDAQGRTAVAANFTLCPDGGGSGRNVTVNMFGRTRVTQVAC